MLITKFNRMIRNRWLWAFIAVAVCLPLGIGLSTSEMGCDEQSADRNVEGRLFGENVSNEEFYWSRFFAMGLREDRSLSPEDQQELRARTWKRLAALKTAERMGIMTSLSEVGELITRDKSFVVDGVFRKDRYQEIVQRQLGVTIGTFENYLQEEITLQKLASILESAAWTSPLEANQRLSDLTDSIVVEYAIAPTNDWVAPITLSKEELQAFYEDQAERFTVPEQVSVRYVTFPISNHLDTIEITTDEISDYYNTNPELYSSTDTNGVSETTPLEEVKEDIEARLKFQAAAFKAKDLATDLVLSITPDRYGRALTFEKATEERDLTVYTSDFFSVSETLTNLAVDLTFNQTAFQLSPSDPDRYFSDAILGEKAIYVLAANQKKEPYLPDFDEIVEQVRPEAEKLAYRDALTEKILEKAKSIEEALESGKTFREVVTGLGLNVHTTQTFTVYEGLPEDAEHADIIPFSVISLAPRELSTPVPVEGGVLFASPLSRTPGEISTRYMLLPQIVQTLDRYRAGLLSREWEDYLLSKAEFEDLHPLSIVTDTEQEDL